MDIKLTKRGRVYLPSGFASIARIKISRIAMELVVQLLLLEAKFLNDDTGRVWYCLLRTTGFIPLALDLIVRPCCLVLAASIKFFVHKILKTP